MGSCDRRRTSIDPRRGFYVGVALIGLGMSLAVGQGVAAANPSDPSDSTDSSQSAAAAAEMSDLSETEDTSDAPDIDSSDAPDGDAGSGIDEAADLNDAADLEEAADLEAADLEAADLEEEADLEEVAEAGEVEAGEADPDVGVVTEADRAEFGAEGDAPTGSRQSSEPATSDDEPVADDLGSSGWQSRSDVVEPDKVDTSAAGAPSSDPSAVESDDVVPAIAVAVPVRMDLAAPAVARIAPTLPSLVNTRPVTVNSMVTDLLTWVGLSPETNGPATPAVPASALVQALWLAVRQTQYTLNNQRPTAEATMSGPGPDGVLTGSLNAVDYDDTALTYGVTGAPEHGSVAIDAFGNFTYTPDPGASLHGDRFTVTIDDTVGNPFHIHGLFGFLGITGPTKVTIVVAPSPARRNDPATIDLADLLSRGGVEVTATPDGAVSVIDGRFTDQVVTTAADAAAVMNSLAPVLGTATGFADPLAITVASAGVGSSVESFYRLSETIGGIEVIGSDMILVTDADGAVTSLFNSYRGLGQGFDLTPAATVDEDFEIHLIAGTAYTGGADPDALESLLGLGTFTDQLIVYALDDDAAPSLAWQVVVQLPDNGDMSRRGATYLIHADGADAGAIIATISNVADASATVQANDWRGDERTITVDSSQIFFFTSHKMFDEARDITTYKTSFPFFGWAGSLLPGSVVKRGWFGWDRGAVSAHANTAVVYDYYQDVLGRTSFDGAGAPIVVSIRYNPGPPMFGSYSNAFWDPDIQQFAYGDGGYLQAALDIVGHEFTHGVVSYVVGDGGSVLDYGESGALNEAYADILGALVEGKSGTDRWLIGEDSRDGAIRNLADPGSIATPYGAYRAHYETRYTGSGDEGGEHVNSTIFSHAVYQMMTAEATNGVSDEIWSSLFYQSLHRLSPGATFIDGRAAVLSAATALAFDSGQIDAIDDAFDSVGIIGAAASSTIAA